MEKEVCDIYKNPMKNLYKSLYHALEKQKSLALATVVDAEGSTPQIPGVSALFSCEGLIEGTLGGGVLEGAAEEKAREAQKEGTNHLFEFDFQDDFSSSSSAVCGGKLKILIQGNPLDHKEVFAQLNLSLVRHNSGVLAALIKKTNQKNFSLARFWIENRDSGIELPSCLNRFEKDIWGVLEKRKPRFFQIKNQKSFSGRRESYLFLEPVVPPLQLVVVGAGHVGKAVSHLGHFLNFEVTVIDDRPEFVNKERIPEADHLIVDNIEEAVRRYPVTEETCIVIVTRGHSYDAQALKECIHSQAGYIGMMGSQRKVQLMKQRFIEKGWATKEQFERIQAPVGIPIQSQTVEEIAVSIAAQLIQIRNKKRG